MSTSSQIDVEAERVRRTIAEDVKAGSSELVEFSQQYARNSKHKNAALAIKVGASNIEDPAIADSLRGRMTGILDDIFVDRARQDPSVSERLQARERLYARFRKEASKQETICRLDEITKRFKRSGFVLGPVSFDFRAGEITALTGENAHGQQRQRHFSGACARPAILLEPCQGAHRLSGAEIAGLDRGAGRHPVLPRRNAWIVSARK
jgi:ATPase subunit of ABC transporter with duplicated ATPase domains